MRNVKITDDMDAAAMAEMKPLFEELAATDESIAFDLSNVAFIDSSGVGAIVFVFKRLRVRGHEVKLTHVTGQPLRLLNQLQLGFMIVAGDKAAA
jgi:anti-sigma B factor antagonist